MRLTQKYFSDLDVGALSTERNAGDRGVLIEDRTFSGKDPFCKTERSPYVVQLSNCTLYPAKSLRRWYEMFFPAGTGSDSRKGARPFIRKPGNLIVTRDGRLTCGSLTRDASMPAPVAAAGPETWDVNLPKVADQIDEPVVFIDLVCAHFGHLLVDTPSRLWYRLEPSLEHLRGLPMIGFGTHGLGNRPGMRSPSEWPGYVRTVLGALGVDPEQVRILRRPTRCRSVFIPKRLSPYWSQFGFSHRYLDTMQAAGDSLVGGRETNGSSRRVYLSRSKLDETRRGLLGGQESAIEDIFRRQGFEIVHPQLLSLADQVRTIRGATHVAGCVGSQMHLLAFGRNQGRHAFRIAPSFFDTPIDRTILEADGGHYASFVVDHDAPTGVKRNHVSWSLTDDDMMRLKQAVAAWRDATTDLALAAS